MFGKGQDVVVVIGDREFGGAVECFLEALDDVDLVFYLCEEIVDTGQPDIEQEGRPVLAADGGKRVADAFEGLEHDGDVAVGQHGPDEVAFPFLGYRHDQVEAELLIECDGGVDVLYKDVW